MHPPGIVPTRLIAAWGNQDSITYHASDVGLAQVILFGDDAEASTDPLVEIKAAEDISYFDVGAVRDCARFRGYIC